MPVTRIEIFTGNDKGGADTDRRFWRIYEIWRTVKLFSRNSVILREVLEEEGLLPNVQIREMEQGETGLKTDRNRYT